MRNETDLRRVFAARRQWAVMHFAAYAYVGESTLDPAKYYDNNVGGTAKLRPMVRLEPRRSGGAASGARIPTASDPGRTP
jgi:UDP-glucose 4-epimerase